MTARTQPAGTGEPWWRIKMLWLVIGGPAVVVVASFVTLALAIRHPDPVLRATPAQAAGEAKGADGAAHVPAMQARNHVQTGGVPPAEHK